MNHRGLPLKETTHRVKQARLYSKREWITLRAQTLDSDEEHVHRGTAVHCGSRSARSCQAVWIH